MSLLTFISSALLFAAAAQAAGTDAAAACREAHERDPPAHIACLETALRTRDETAREADELGSEQVRRGERDTPPRSVAVQIVSTTYNADGRGVFRMADGQVWQETEVTPERQRLTPDAQYAARIERSRFGGYRMYVDGVRRMIKLERLE